jgi:arylsulfatase A-like enzyme
LPRLLGKAGVRSFLCGKWHLTHRGVPDYHSLPVRVGFTRAAGSLWNLDAGPGVGYHAWWKNVATSAGWAEMPVTTYATTASYAEAYSALVASAAAGNRSLIWLALNAAHTPFDLPPDGLYTPVDGHNTDPKSQRYVLEAADTLLGQLREPFASAEPAAAARTLWIVMGDNGTPAAALERPWPAHQHKNTVYEGGTRVPLIVAGAVVPARGTVCDALVLETNHDLDLLWGGDYPKWLKERIGGPFGHLDNASSGRLLAALERSRLKHVIAAHLSAQNNTAELARAALAAALGCEADWVGVATQEAGCGWRDLA